MYVCMYVLWLPKFNHIRDSGVKVLCFLHLPSALHGTSMLMLGTCTYFCPAKGEHFGLMFSFTVSKQYRISQQIVAVAPQWKPESQILGLNTINLSDEMI